MRYLIEVSLFMLLVNAFLFVLLGDMNDGQPEVIGSQVCYGGGCEKRVCVSRPMPDESEQALEDSTPKD